MRMAIELRRNENAYVVLNNLFRYTQLQDSFNFNMVALDNGQPRLLNLKQLLEIFVRHRREVVTRRPGYRLRKARERGNVWEGRSVALAPCGEITELIRRPPSSCTAKAGWLSGAWDTGTVHR